MPLNCYLGNLMEEKKKRWKQGHANICQGRGTMYYKIYVAGKRFTTCFSSKYTLCGG